MYLVREVLHCKPGKVRQMAEMFKAISRAWNDMGQAPMRLLTDVSGEPFWTLLAEAQVEKVEDFFALEQRLMADDGLRKAMTGYHELIEDGRREIYRIES